MTITSETIGDSTLEMLILYLLEWLETDVRTYEEVMEAWRTSCPRLPVWETVNERRFVRREEENGNEVVRLTPTGANVLRKHRLAKIMENYLEGVTG